jgi:acyl-homoserine-lactone acylase
MSNLGRIGRSKFFRGVAALTFALGAWRIVRPMTLPKPPRPDAQTFEQQKRVRIVRDNYGVPHIFGKSDADAAFGLAYAHAEDDFATIQGVLAAGTGRLSLLSLSKVALGNDYYANFVRVREQVDAHYMELSPEYREVLEGYARGLNLYAYLHPKEADGRLYPMTGRDLAAGFIHKIPLMFDMHKLIVKLVDGPPLQVDDPQPTAAIESQARSFPGSNAQAVSRQRSSDDTTRLNINSHQPWEGPVTWYEAQIVSEQGWNMTGGLFPGAPIALVGHNDSLGWAMTVNYPDLVDVYALHTDAAHPDAYELDGAWVPFEKKEAPLTIDTGLFNVTVHKTVYYAKHGPVVRTDKGAWAIRYAGIERAIFSGQEWYQMNKATSLAEWRAAVRIHAVPMFNMVYADREHIHYVYNALLPKRENGPNWAKVLPGNQSKLIWDDYLRADDLPRVTDPASGFVQGCNASPFVATRAGEAPQERDFDPNFGIHDPVTNRAKVTLKRWSDVSKPISREDFLALKWDDSYAADSFMALQILAPLTAYQAANEPEKQGLALLANWDRHCNVSSTAAALAILTMRGVNPDVAGGPQPPLPLEKAFQNAVQWLVKTFGRVDVQLGEMQRLRRGNVDLPVGGGPDVLNATYGQDLTDRLVGTQGDSYVLIAEFGKDGVRSQSVHQYGASCKKDSPHYADQAPMFVKHEMKPTYRDPKDLAAHTERSYVPGE